MSVDKLLEQAFVRVTEEAAVAAAHTMGLGDCEESDRVAVEAIRRELGKLIRFVDTIHREDDLPPILFK